MFKVDRLQDDELKKLSETMLTKGKKKMYTMIMNGKTKQKEKASNLQKKREKLKKINKLIKQQEE